NVTVTKKGYEDSEFGGSISADGEFSPAGGSYPEMVKEKKEDESPGFGLAVMLAGLAIATILAVVTRGRRW
ncbi:MAG: hypothetical protein GWN18_05475, partial [Thermoplasmata archaeon]|nr:hypothetical protein [Thermoplasmata archaeon]NIS11150.1 hypothetical protein [Thermoplasmata archaeon]NIS19086.1 hypothetical protein [Thermoplasmata archaeon]NIT76148.1 hypothetical protein [Thermoplasmata archaeon]NIU48233.1 hypothetical protein [Thermoplasmata archaeon]